ncbi:ABC transporter substrate-binding protein [Neomoorella thermoacetica]|uniref:ABC transporter substrate-binding protein n=1 Tax=Neomoorella thermoacetica TaxID=1525 RepID=UPI0008FB7D1F|nr:ABC transporter substrate-binding protein [Moorella thermoacetica]APC09002.1 leucine-, isoleucine-, valine-, threonine-, and alanine-binding protein precursor [Moorella thermoacetica]OIQ55050.1 leucine-, isoleucine-, valine-, threonine-, and alanine-binding protein precursor [Moorella thermoacetica]
MKKFTLSVIALVLAMVLVACGQSNSSKGAQTSGGNQGGNGDQIIIGNLQDLSSTTSVWGKAVTNGAQLAIDKINKDGGINGKKLKLVTYDTKNDVQEAINAYNRLATQDKAVAIIGPPVSNIGIALAPIAENTKVSILGSFIDERATTKNNGKPWGYNFLIQPSSVQQAQIMAGYTMDKLNLKKIGVLYNQANAYSVSLAKPFVDYVKAHGGQIVSEQTYKTTDKDYKTQLAEIQAAGAEAIYLPNYIQENVLAVQQARQMGISVPIVGALDFAPPFAKLAGDAANDIYFPNNIAAEDPQIREVAAAYKAAYNDDPLNKAFIGYDSILVIADAIKRAGAPDPVKVHDALEQTKDLKGTTGNISISPTTHRPYGLSMVMIKIEKGQYVTQERYITKEQQQQ